MLWPPPIVGDPDFMTPCMHVIINKCPFIYYVLYIQLYRSSPSILWLLVNVQGTWTMFLILCSIFEPGLWKQKLIIGFNPQYGPRKTLSGAYAVIIGIPEWSLYLIVHNIKCLLGHMHASEPVELGLRSTGVCTDPTVQASLIVKWSMQNTQGSIGLHIFLTTQLSIWGLCGPLRLQTSKFFCNRGWGLSWYFLEDTKPEQLKDKHIAQNRFCNSKVYYKKHDKNIRLGWPEV